MGKLFVCLQTISGCVRDRLGSLCHKPEAFEILPRYHAERFHEIASACANQCKRLSPIRLAVREVFLEKHSFSLAICDGGTIENGKHYYRRESLGVESDSNVVLANWSEELDAAPLNIGNGITQGQSKTRAKKHVSSTLKESSEPISGTKDPTKSLESDAPLPKTGGKTSADGPKPPKKASTVKKAGSSSKGKRLPKPFTTVACPDPKFNHRRGCCFERGFLWPCYADEQRIQRSRKTA